MTNVLKSYHLFCIFLLYVGRLGPTSSKTDINKTLCNCFLQPLSHFLACENVKLFRWLHNENIFWQICSIHTNQKTTHLWDNGSCCLYTTYILVFRLVCSQNFSSLSNSSIHTSLQTWSKIFLHFQIVLYILVFSLSQNFSSLSNSSIHTRYYPLTKCHFNRPGETRICPVKGILALFCYILTFGLF